MVVQCPTCQSKFRIADDKVNDRGVRVRCTSCKNVFQVRKSGVVAGDGAPADPPPAPARPAPKPALRPAAPPPDPFGNSLDSDDLFGMAELTGESQPLEAPLPAPKPIAARPPSARPRAASPSAAPAATLAAPVKLAPKPVPSFDDIDLEVNDRPPRPPTPRPAPSAPRLATPPPPEPAMDDIDFGPPTRAEPPPAPPVSDPGAVRIGAFKTQLKDPFEGLDMGEQGTGAIELATQKKKDKLAESVQREVPPPDDDGEEPEPRTAEPPPRKAVISSALTGLLGTALAVAVVIVSALSDESTSSWLGMGPASEVVATHVSSGLYDTATGKPVFFVRGRVENRSKTERGPARVIAELVNDGTPEGHAEAIAGAEPTPEDVWSLKTSADVDKLLKTLDLTPVERKLAPGASLPFFAVILDPPQNLSEQRLRVRVETVDAWNPPPVKVKEK